MRSLLLLAIHLALPFCLAHGNLDVYDTDAKDSLRLQVEHVLRSNPSPPGSVDEQQLLHNIDSATDASFGAASPSSSSTSTSRAAGDNGQRNVQRACFALRTLYTGSSTEFSDQRSPDYLNLTEFNWAENAWLAPACIVRPTSAVAVAAGLKVITVLQVPFSVRGAGHNPNVGFSGINGTGILLDLSNMRGVSVSADRASVLAQPGNQWIDVYNALAPYGLAAIGTKEPVPGVVGPIIGGGDPFFPELYGLACDNVLDFQLVLANSTVTHANAKLNADLFRAMKGGAANFGVITQVTLRTVPISGVWWSFVEYDLEETDQLLHALQEYQQLAEGDPRSNVALTLTPTVTVIGFFYANHTVDSPAAFAPFRNISSKATLIAPTNGTIAQLSQAVGAMTTAGARYRSIAALTTKSGESTYRAINANFRTALQQLPSSANVILSFQTKTSRFASVTGGNVLGIQPIQQQWSALLVEYTDAAQSDAVNHFISVLDTGARSAVQAAGGSVLPFLFQNDAGFWQKPLLGIGAQNLAFLRGVSRKVDPNGIFQTLQFNGFLLSKMT